MRLLAPGGLFRLLGSWLEHAKRFLRPSSRSAPVVSRITRESTDDATENAMRAGKLALINPVTTSTLGRCVAMIK